MLFKVHWVRQRSSTAQKFPPPSHPKPSSPHPPISHPKVFLGWIYLHGNANNSCSTGLLVSERSSYHRCWQHDLGLLGRLNPLTPKSDQSQISPAASPQIFHHSMKNLAFHSLLRQKMIILPILTTSLIHFSLQGWENVLFELESYVSVSPFCCWVVCVFRRCCRFLRRRRRRFLRLSSRVTRLQSSPPFLPIHLHICRKLIGLMRMAKL